MKVLIIASSSDSFFNFRYELIKRIYSKSHKIVLMAPFIEQDTKLQKKFFNMKGISFENFNFERTSMNLFLDFIGLLLAFFKIKSLKPDIVLTYTIKPVIYGTIISKLIGINKIFALITGLGYIFISKGKRSPTRMIVERLYKVALSHCKKIFFQNIDDSNLFLERKILEDSNKITLLNGSGVDLDFFSQKQTSQDTFNYLFLGRYLRSKGLDEFLNAAIELKEKYPKANFKIGGWFDDNPDRISEDKVYKLDKEKIIVNLGKLEDVRDELQKCSVFVLPSYREGVPRSVMEAMSVGRAIITTDAPGCKETVIDGYNGFLVNPGSSTELVSAMEKFLKHPQLIDEFGKNSRKYAEQKFNVHDVNNKMLEIMKL